MLEPYLPEDYNLAFQSYSCTWKCIVGNLKKWKTGILSRKIISNELEIELKAELIQSFQNFHLISFKWDNSKINFSQLIELFGEIPIPPYLNCHSEEIDKKRYQTVYSTMNGSVAAPTAGLHFTEPLLNELKYKNHLIENITLHVGAGTFKPIQSNDIFGHEMHSEYFSVSKDTIKHLGEEFNNIVCVGTTTLRTLESLYWIAIKIKLNNFSKSILHIDQWEPYELSGDISYNEAMSILLKYMQIYDLNEIHATTSILIMPGYKIKSIKALITNFHQPKSTLLLLVSAIVGLHWKKIYYYALSHNFRFLSYGDSSILFLDC